ncbi:MAG: YceD family protein [Lentilactobacillus diolivorans]|uniref:Acr n=2 Tax=Lentilactobacillus diolivorans TaxID=179838 RepID=A0A0R1SDT5_9LACO|nr:YceD family protein [Lentilactobacillus diolivorans]KRL64594.1 acr [Lentilactobacillus diolivorans DSM 14421]GEP22839.1 DNA-binding protein [Lentilactobacillus diolivorans]
MKWYFKDLQKYSGTDPFTFNETLNIKEELLDRYADEVIDASSFSIDGTAFADRGDVVIDTHIVGELVVPSSRSLKPVHLPLDFTVEEFYVPSKIAESRYSKDDVVFVLDEEDEVDIQSAVIDNVILHIPMHILTPEEATGDHMPSGDDWKVLSLDDYQNQKAELKTVDPRLEKLKNFFKDDHSK